jgi:hypothetical protein
MNRRIVRGPFRAALAVALLVTGCGERETAESESPIDILVTPSTGATVGSLGEGRDYAQESMKDVCLRTTGTFTQGSPYTAFQFASSMAKDDVASMLGYSVDAKARFKIFEGNVKASFARSTTESTYSLTLNYSADYGTAWSMLDSVTGTWSVSPSDPKFYERCGDQVLSKLMKGGSLIVQYKIDFSSLTDKQNFEAAVNAAYLDAATANAKISQELTKYRSRATVKVAAYQSGGDPTRLFTAMGGGSSDGSGAAAIVKCATADLSACGTFMTNAVKYGTGTAATDFPQNVKENPGDREYLFQDWTVFGGPPLRQIPVAVTDARNALLSKFNVQAALKQRLEALNGGAIYVNTEIAPKLPAWTNTVNMNLKYLQDAALLCYDTMTVTDAAKVSACLQAATDASLYAKGYSPSPTLADLDAGQRVGFAGYKYYDGWREALEGDWDGAVGTWPLLGFRVYTRSPLKGARVCYAGLFANGWNEACDGAPVNPAWQRWMTAVRIRLVDAPPGYHICYQGDRGPVGCDNAPISPGSFGALKVWVTP